MENATIVFIDSNYWIYLFDETTSEHPHVKNHFEEIYEKFQFAVNIPVMIEVMHYLVKRLGNNLAKPKWEIFSSMKIDIVRNI